MSQKTTGTKKTVLRRSFLAFIMFLLTFLAVAQVQADKIGIDNFNTFDQRVCDPTTSCSEAVSSSAIDTSGAIGGERDMAVVCLSCGDNVSARDGIASDIVGYSQGTATTGTWEIVWDGNDNDPNAIDHTGLGGFDLTDGGTNIGFYIGDLTNDQAFTFRIEVYTDSGNWSFINSPLQPIQTGATVFLSFASFSTGAGAGVDFSNVGAIRFSVDGSAIPALDVSFDYMTVDDGTPTAITLQGIRAGNDSPPFAAVGLLIITLLSIAVYFYHRKQANGANA